jgi:hypothetical protein
MLVFSMSSSKALRKMIGSRVVQVLVVRLRGADVEEVVWLTVKTVGFGHIRFTNAERNSFRGEMKSYLLV